jgi:phage gpG-like protein
MARSEIVGDAEVLAGLTRFGDQAKASVTKTIRRLAIEVQGYVKTDKLSGQVLKNRTGTLRRSINQQVTTSDEGVFASVGTNLRYARIHEFGGQIHVPELVAGPGKAIKLQLKDGSIIFRKRVLAHTLEMPERSFLRSALSDKRRKIIDDLRGALVGAR